MKELMNDIDATNDGSLNLQEFQTMVENPTIKTWLEGQGLKIHHVELVFNLVDIETPDLGSFKKYMISEKTQMVKLHLTSLGLYVSGCLAHFH